VNVSGLPGGNGDWVGIYPVGSSNDWGNVVSWSYTNGTHSMDSAGIVNGSVNLSGIANGTYEARLFFDNSFTLENSVTFMVSEEVVVSSKSFTDGGNTYMGRIYYNQVENVQRPIVYIVPGASGSVEEHRYIAETLVKEGYVAIAVSLDGFNANSVVNDYFNAFQQGELECEASGILLDNSRVGLVGHSSGAGVLPSLGYKFFVEQNMGNNGRFIFGATPWIDFQHDENQKLPIDTNFVTQWYHDDDSTDPQIYLDMFEYVDVNNKAFITVKTSSNPNHQNFVEPDVYNADIGITHYVLLADPDQHAVVAEGIHKPLKDLAYYTFTNSNKERIFSENRQDTTYYQITANGELPSDNFTVMEDGYNASALQFGCDGSGFANNPREAECEQFFNLH
ncbi:MAG: hypothetical protein K0U47_05785, partial [Epsilonproteobacteria bacterium]|nr:hypothetical protein [Campylobacterota bacterium]